MVTVALLLTLNMLDRSVIEITYLISSKHPTHAEEVL